VFKVVRERQMMLDEDLADLYGLNPSARAASPARRKERLAGHGMAQRLGAVQRPSG
jgi:hypothetical protein